MLNILALMEIPMKITMRYQFTPNGYNQQVLLFIFLAEMKTDVYPKTCTQIFIAALFIIATK